MNRDKFMKYKMSFLSEERDKNYHFNTIF